MGTKRRDAEPLDRALVVEDDDVLREHLQRTLDENGYVVDAVESGEEALRTLERDVYDLVLLDLDLPGMDGMDTLRLIHARLPDAQVIVITPFATVDKAIEAVNQGAFDYINKPFKTDALLLRLRRAREERALQREVSRLRRELQEEEGGVQIARDILSQALDRRWTLQQMEKEYILRTLERVGRRKTLAAHWLGIDRRTLYRKLKQYSAERATRGDGAE